MRACGIPIVFSTSSGAAERKMLERLAQFSQTADGLFEAVSELEDELEMPPLDDAPPQQSEETKQETKTVSEVD